MQEGRAVQQAREESNIALSSAGLVATDNYLTSATGRSDVEAGSSHGNPPAVSGKRGRVPAEMKGRHEAARKIQAYFIKKSCSVRVHRQLLVERSSFESRMIAGTRKLLNYLCLFLLFVFALGFANRTKNMRGEYVNLDSAFAFDSLRGPSTVPHLHQHLAAVSEASKRFFLLSNLYYEEDPAGLSQYIGPMTVFSGPEAIAASPVIDHGNFSFSAWVDVSSEVFFDGYIVRKAVPGDEGLTCWGWYLHSTRGVGFHYAGHDYYSAEAHRARDSSGTPRQIQVGADFAEWPSAVALLTLVVTSSEVVFFRNDNEVLRAQLPRPVTDCLNPNGILVGAAAMTVGQLRQYSAALEPITINEIYTNGARLVDLSTGNVPKDLSAGHRRTFEVELQEEMRQQQQAVKEDLSIGQMLLSLEAEGKWAAHAPAEQPADGAHSTLPEQPHGKQTVNQTLVVDEATGREYTSLIGPASHLSPSVEAEAEPPRYFDGADVPSFYGTGVTFTFWLRTVSAGGYLLSSQPMGRGQDSFCWNMYWDLGAQYFYAGLSDQSNASAGTWTNLGAELISDAGFLDGFAPSGLQGFVWRHFAVQLNDLTNTMDTFLDGALVKSYRLATAVTRLDCQGPDRVVALGHRFPGYTYGWETDIADMRMYVGGPPFTPAQIRNISTTDTGPVRQGTNTCTPLTEIEDRGDWTDALGNDCQTYREKRLRSPAICKRAAARAACPVACAAVEECYGAGGWSTSAPPPVFLSWDRIRRIKKQPYTNGTVCVGDDVDIAAVVQDCVRWVNSSDPAAYARVRGYMFSDRTHTPMVDILDCEALQAALDPYCAFNASAVSAFTDAVKANGGDFTIAFWVKAEQGGSSLDPRGLFAPQVVLHKRLLPDPKYFLGTFASQTAAQPLGLEIFESCRDSNENLEVGPVSKEGWSLITFARQNSTWPHCPMAAYSDRVTFKENSGAWLHCTAPGRFFDFIEFSQAMLVSPIVMIPAVVPAAVIREQYYSSLAIMNTRPGPLRTNGERQAAAAAVKKNDYTPSLFLLAPPMIMQQRHHRGGTCPFSFAQGMINFTQTQVEDRCRGKQCPEGVLDGTTSVAQCTEVQPRGGEAATQTVRFYGRNETIYRGKVGFVDFLYSITDAPFLFRGGGIVSRGTDYIDTLTKNIRVTLPFYSPQIGITSVLLIDGALDRTLDVDIAVHLEHYETLEGRARSMYLLLNVLIVIVIGVLLVDILHDLWDILQFFRRRRAARAAPNSHDEAVWPWPREGEPHPNIGIVGIDVCIATTILIYVAVSLTFKLNSVSETSNVVGALGKIRWADGTTDNETKTKAFLEALGDLMDLIQTEATLSAICNAILVVTLVRILAALSVHPRLGLLTSTIIAGLDDLWHTALLVVVLVSLFATIGFWRFGAEHEAYSGLGRACITLSKFLMVGEFPAKWDQTWDMLVYTSIFVVFGFLLVMNFLLAVVVEAYLRVRAINEDVVLYEQEYFSDLLDSVVVAWYRSQLAGRVFPEPGTLTRELAKWRGLQSVGYRELLHTGLFRSSRHIKTFLAHYRQKYEFMEPPAPTQEQIQEAREMRQRAIDKQKARRPPALPPLHSHTLGNRPLDHLKQLDSSADATSDDLGASSPILRQVKPGGTRTSNPIKDLHDHAGD